MSSTILLALLVGVSMFAFLVSLELVDLKSQINKTVGTILVFDQGEDEDPLLLLEIDKSTDITNVDVVTLRVDADANNRLNTR